MVRGTVEIEETPTRNGVKVLRWSPATNSVVTELLTWEDIIKVNSFRAAEQAIEYEDSSSHVIFH